MPLGGKREAVLLRVRHCEPAGGRDVGRQLLCAGERGGVGVRLQVALRAVPRAHVDHETGHPEQDDHPHDRQHYGLSGLAPSGGLRPLRPQFATSHAILLGSARPQACVCCPEDCQRQRARRQSLARANRGNGTKAPTTFESSGLLPSAAGAGPTLTGARRARYYTCERVAPSGHRLARGAALKRAGGRRAPTLLQVKPPKRDCTSLFGGTGRRFGGTRRRPQIAAVLSWTRPRVTFFPSRERPPQSASPPGAVIGRGSAVNAGERPDSSPNERRIRGRRRERDRPRAGRRLGLRGREDTVREIEFVRDLRLDPGSVDGLPRLSQKGNGLEARPPHRRASTSEPVHPRRRLSPYSTPKCEAVRRPARYPSG